MRSSFVPSSSSSERQKSIAPTMTKSPVNIQIMKAVCIESEISFLFSVPMQRATMTLTPLPMPISMPVKSVTSIAVEPTEPSAPEPANLPTTAISDILNNTCNIFENISGRLNRRIFFGREPVVRSPSRVAAAFVFIFLFFRFSYRFD